MTLELSTEQLDIIEKWQETVPVDIVALAKALGLNVYESELPNNISGKIVKDNKHGGTSGYYIVVDKADVKSRKRFTVAHEIAHFLLHRGLLGDELIDEGVTPTLNRSRLSNSVEQEANRLAARLLMPLGPIYALMEKEGLTDLDQIAKKIEVSPQALSIRLSI